MNKEEEKELKDLYTRLRDEIVSSVQVMSQREVDASGDDVDAIQAKSLTHITERLGHRDMIRLRRLSYALKVMESGEINECEECCEPIGYKRLKAIPGVRACVLCAEKSEIRSR